MPASDDLRVPISDRGRHACRRGDRLARRAQPLAGDPQRGVRLARHGLGYVPLPVAPGRCARRRRAGESRAPWRQRHDAAQDRAPISPTSCPRMRGDCERSTRSWWPETGWSGTTPTRQGSIGSCGATQGSTPPDGPRSCWVRVVPHGRSHSPSRSGAPNCASPCGPRTRRRPAPHDRGDGPRGRGGAVRRGGDPACRSRRERHPGRRRRSIVPAHPRARAGCAGDRSSLYRRVVTPLQVRAREAGGPSRSEDSDCSCIRPRCRSSCGPAPRRRST